MKTLRNFFVLCVFGLCLCACSERKTLVDIGNEKQILYIANGADPADIDPQITTGSVEHRIEGGLFEPLVTKNLTTLEIEPAIAESWTVSDDGLVYEFKIRENAKWSNGDDLVADDFVQSWRRVLSPRLGSEWATYLYVLKNGEEYHTGKITDFSEVGVEAVSEKVLKVTLSGPAPYFLQLLDHNCMYPVHIKTILKHGEFDERSTPWTRPENFVGNGPFVPVEWVPNKAFVMAKNPLYWNQERIKLTEVHIVPVEGTLAMERMYRAGQLHMVEKLPPAKIAAYKNDPALHSFPLYGTYFYRFNTTVKPLDDVRVRQALSYSINREQITKTITRGGEPVMRSLVPITPTYEPSYQFPENVGLAKKLLAEAGFPDGKGFPKLVLTYNTQEEHQKIAVAIQQMWKKNLGIDIQLQNQEWKVFLSNQHHMNYQISRASWVGDYVDPNTFLEIFITTSGNNETGWASAEYDALIRAASLEKDADERIKIMQAAEKIIMTELPIMPIYGYSWNRLVSPSVQNWNDNVQDYFSFTDVYLIPSEK